MVKFILRKTVFKKYDKETQDHLLPLLTKKYTTIWFCGFMFHLLFFIAPFILLYFSVNGKELDSVYNIVLGISISLYVCLLSFFYGFFHTEIMKFCTETLPDRLYNRIYAQRGKAISKEDFKKIKEKYDTLYQCITSCLCHGYCYSICFAILKTLKKGKIKFIAIKELTGSNCPYTMHVLYENNGWIFDTYNQRQYPVEKALILHKAIIYKDFSYEDIKGLSYEEFRDKNYEELAKWCTKHDCYQYWKEND